MAMKDGAGTPLDPANLWGKPDPRARSAREKKVSRTMDEEHMEDDDIDVDAELDRADEEGDLEVDVDDEALEDAEDFETEDGDEIGDEADEDVEESEELVVADADAELADDVEIGEDETAESADDEAEFDDDDANLAADEEKTPVATSRKRDMADKKTSLSDHIRSEINRRKASGDSLRGKDIVEALAGQRIKVSPAQVSQIMKKEGLSGSKPGRPKASSGTTEERSRSALKVNTKKQPALKPPASGKPPAAKVRPARESGSFSFGLPIAQLKAAETFVDACGGLKNAERILTLTASLSNQFEG
jgi:hypothetical protein